MDSVFIATICFIIVIELLCPLTVINLDIEIPGYSRYKLVENNDDTELEDERKIRRSSDSERQLIKHDNNNNDTREFAETDQQNLINTSCDLNGRGNEKLVTKDSVNSFKATGSFEESIISLRNSLLKFGKAALRKADEKSLIQLINLAVFMLILFNFTCLSCIVCDQITVNKYFQTKVTSAIVLNLLFRTLKDIHRKDIGAYLGEYDLNNKFLNNCKQKVKILDYDWFLKKLYFVQARSDEVVTIFPAFQDAIHRLASYRNIFYVFNTSAFSPSELSQNGFYYTGSGSIVKCEKCGKEVELSSFIAGDCRIDTRASFFHNAGCTYAEYDQSNYADHPMYNQQNNVRDTTPCRSTTNPVTKSLEICVVFPPLLTTNETRSQYVHPTEQGQTLTPGVPGRGEFPRKTVGIAQHRMTNKNFDPVKRTDDILPPRFRNTAREEVSGLSDQESTNGEASSTALDHAPPEAVDVISSETVLVTPEHGTVNKIKNENLHRMTCEKNPGHYGSYPMNQLTTQQIPSQTRHQDVLTFLQLFSMLTVKIVVNVTSSLHREIDPSCPRGNEPRIGTGFVSLGNKSWDDGPAGETIHRQWGTVKQFFKTLLKKPEGEIHIETNRHLVFDATEAANSSVEFFFDQPHRQGINVFRGLSVLDSEVKAESRTVLICKILDHGLVDRILQIKRQLMVVGERLPARAKAMMCRKVFVISHPHGKEKVLSYGDSVQVKFAVNPTAEEGRRVIKINSHEQVSANLRKPMKMLMYAADTCPGSCGALVISFKKGPCDVNDHTTYRLDIWIHNGVDKNNSLGCSTMKECTEEDLKELSNSRPQTYTDVGQGDSDSDDEQSSNNETETSKVLKVLSHPVYPSHISYQKRLETFVLWPAHHIATPIFLAMAGFFYAGYADCVRCFQCGLGLRSWKVGDNVYDEHRKHRPTCPFLQAQLRSGVNTTEVTPQTPGIHRASKEKSFAPPDGTSEQRKLSSSGGTNMMDTLTQQSLMIPNPTVTVSFALDDQQKNAHIVAANATNSQPQTDLTLKLLQQEQTKLQEQLLCKVCFQAPSRDVFLPCGELYACTECSKLLTHCPSCSKQILATVTTYLT